MHTGVYCCRSIKCQLWYGALECTCSHATVHDGAADMSDEFVRRHGVKCWPTGDRLCFIKQRRMTSPTPPLISMPRAAQVSRRTQAAGAPASREQLGTVGLGWLKIAENKAVLKKNDPVFGGHIEGTTTRGQPQSRQADGRIAYVWR